MHLSLPLFNFTQWKDKCTSCSFTTKKLTHSMCQVSLVVKYMITCIFDHGMKGICLSFNFSTPLCVAISHSPYQFFRTISFRILGVPMNNLAPMKKLSWGMQGNLNWMPGYMHVCSSFDFIGKGLPIVNI